MHKDMEVNKNVFESKTINTIIMRLKRESNLFYLTNTFLVNKKVTPFLNLHQTNTRIMN